MSPAPKENTTLLEGLKAWAHEAHAVRCTTDFVGNIFHWFRMDRPRHIVPAAQLLKDCGARLSTTTAYMRHHLSDPVQEVCYHFELDGVLYNVTVMLDAEWPAVPSITPIYKNADWHEREMMELYAVQVTGHPNPRRLFLDETIDEGIMGEAVPLSIMMNGACTIDLWERIMKTRHATEARTQA